MKSVLRALAVTFSYQVLSSILVIAPSVMTPAVAPALDVAPQAIGLFTMITYAIAMFGGLACESMILRYGPLRVIQGSLATMAIGLAFGASGHLAGAIVFALLLGVGYGFINPATGSILAKHAPPERLALIFSIKQSGVPAGAAIAGAVIPAMLLIIGWQVSLLGLAGCCVALALAIQPTRSEYDAEAIARRTNAIQTTPPSWLARLRHPLLLVCSNRVLLELAITSLVYSCTQAIVFAYLVSHLNLQVGFSLVAAGMVYAATSIAGIAGRIFWGYVADRWVRPRIMLGVLGIVMGGSCVLIAQVGAAWPLAVVVAIAIILGATSLGWQGVYFADMARRSPEGKVGTVTAGAQVFTYGGAMIGPPLFGLIVAASNSYALAYMLMAIIPMTVGIRGLLFKQH